MDKKDWYYGYNKLKYCIESYTHSRFVSVWLNNQVNMYYKGLLSVGKVKLLKLIDEDIFDKKFLRHRQSYLMYKNYEKSNIGNTLSLTRFLTCQSDFLAYRLLVRCLNLWGISDLLGFRYEYIKLARLSGELGYNVSAFRCFDDYFSCIYPSVKGSGLRLYTVVMGSVSYKGFFKEGTLADSFVIKYGNGDEYCKSWLKKAYKLLAVKLSKNRFHMLAKYINGMGIVEVADEFNVVSATVYTVVKDAHKILKSSNLISELHSYLSN